MPVIGAGQRDCCADARAVTQNTLRFLVQFHGIILPPFAPLAARLRQIFKRLDVILGYVGKLVSLVMDPVASVHVP